MGGYNEGSAGGNKEAPQCMMAETMVIFNR